MAAPLATPTLVSVKGVQAAFGLRWESVPAPSLKGAQAHLLRSMKQANVKYAVLNEADDRRFVGGLCLTAPTQRLAKTFSAAVWLSESRRSATLAIAELGPETLWVGVADPGVWLGGDFVGSSAESGQAIDAALDHFDRLGQTPTILVVTKRPDGTPITNFPVTGRMSETLAALGLANPEFVEWEGLLTEVPSRDALIGQMAGVDARTSWLFIALAGLAAVGYLGNTLWVQHQERERLRLEAEQASLEARNVLLGPSVEELDAEREKRKAIAIAAAIQRHTDTVEPVIFLEHCDRALKGLGVSLQGWVLTELSCDATSLSGTWSSPAAIGILTLTERVARRLEAASPTSLEIDPSGRQVRASWQRPPLPTRGGWSIAELPEDGTLRRLLLTRSQLQSVGSRGAVSLWAIAPAAPADITYVDPALESEINNPARFVHVQPPEGFRVASVAISGVGAWRLDSLPLDLRAVSIRKIVFRPGQMASGQDQTPWSVEADYVVR